MKLHVCLIVTAFWLQLVYSAVRAQDLPVAVGVHADKIDEVPSDEDLCLDGDGLACRRVSARLAEGLKGKNPQTIVGAEAMQYLAVARCAQAYENIAISLDALNEVIEESGDLSPEAQQCRARLNQIIAMRVLLCK